MRGQRDLEHCMPISRNRQHKARNSPRRTRQIYDSDWERLAARHRRLFPLCVVKGCRKKAQHVDHIVSVREAPERRLDATNLQSLCHKHHNVVTKAYDAGSIAGACDAAGRTLDPNHPWAQADNEHAIAAVNDERRPPKGYAGRLKRDAVTARGRIPHLQNDQN